VGEKRLAFMSMLAKDQEEAQKVKDERDELSRATEQL
jgi:hypothetical protein